MTKEMDTPFPCGRVVYGWKSCKNCPDYPCEIIKKEQKK